MNWIARVGAVLLGVAWGCTTTNESHCGNQNGDATCMERGFTYCDRCSAVNDGCSDKINHDPGCYDGDAGTSSSSGGATSTVTTDTTTMSTSMTTTTLSTSDATDEGSSSTGSLPCGNGVIDGDETCDGEDLNGHDCATEGLGTGTVSCTDDCMLDLSQCEPAEPGCGDDEIQGTEQCDGSNFGAQTCMGFSPQYGGGQLMCNDNCTINPINCCVAQFQNCSLSTCCEGFSCSPVNTCI